MQECYKIYLEEAKKVKDQQEAEAERERKRKEQMQAQQQMPRRPSPIIKGIA